MVKTLLVGAAALAVCIALVAGCGTAAGTSIASTASITTSTVAIEPTTTEQDALPTTTTATGSTAAPAGLVDVFAGLAATLRPLTIFAPTEMPAGAKLAPYWLPVIESASPAQNAVRHDNPYVVGGGDDAEVQIVLQADKGWLVIIENFHGDLGDVTGTHAGAVDGNPASIYEVNGGQLVQWSRDGKWYGVFGRGVSRDAILALALGMVQASAESL